jgi:hypothetical protein
MLGTWWLTSIHLKALRETEPNRPNSSILLQSPGEAWRPELLFADNAPELKRK